MMGIDVSFVVGCVLLVLAFPAAVGAFTEGRPPRSAAILVMVGGGLLALAVYQRPGAYSVETVPAVFARVAQGALS